MGRPYLTVFEPSFYTRHHSLHPPIMPIQLIMYAIAGAGITVTTVPVIVTTVSKIVGFTSTGIAAGSYAAGMMSTAAAPTGMVASGSLVATLQSIGAAGIATNGAILGSAGAAIGTAIGSIFGTGAGSA